MKTVQQLFDLSGQAALVTGGAGLLGTAISEALAEAGARVAIASRNLDHCQETARQLGSDHLGLQLDIGSEASNRGVVDEVAQRFGRLDILVNCAYSGPRPDIEEATADEFDEALHLSITAYFVTSQQAVRHMRAQGKGSIIQIASMYGVVGSYPEVYEGTGGGSPPTYHAGKGGLVHLTRYMAVYWAKDGIRVNAISPGPFPTPEGLRDEAEFYQRLAHKVPLQRVGEPWELKGATVFLASEASSYVTGQNLMVEGGWTIW